MRALTDRLELYPDGASTALREAIGRRHGLDPTQIICGNGSDELLALLAHVFLHPGEEGLYSQYGFLTYPICIRAAGGIPVVAEEMDRTASVDAILAKVSARTKIVYLANPNNPTGTYIPYSEVQRLHAGLPPHTLLVIDAAYAEYVTRNDYAAGLELASTADNVVMTRTFSKIHGLAGLRVGWAYGSAHVVDALNRVRGPFNLNGAAQAAGVASLEDAAHIEGAIAHNAHWLTWLADEIAGLGVEVTPSVGKFSAADLSQRIRADCRRRGRVPERQRAIFSGSVAAYGLPDSLRLTVGGEEANKGVVASLAEFTRGKGG